MSRRHSGSPSSFFKCLIFPTVGNDDDAAPPVDLLLGRLLPCPDSDLMILMSALSPGVLSLGPMLEARDQRLWSGVLSFDAISTSTHVLVWPLVDDAARLSLINWYKWR